MVARLKARGYHAMQTLSIAPQELARRNAGGFYDCVACLNVLDRCDRPITMLRQIHRILRPGSGKLLLSLVLPFDPFVEDGRLEKQREPSEQVQCVQCAQSFEESANLLAAHLLEPLGFTVLALARVPYLAEGDLDQSHYELDNCVFVLRREVTGD
jgi:SAM-dependent methyltransferase